jgi:hypothetical protein
MQKFALLLQSDCQIAANELRTEERDISDSTDKRKPLASRELADRMLFS